MDFDDLNIYDLPDVGPRQFAPEFSQNAFTAMLGKDIVVGDYINAPFRLTHASCSNGKFSFTASQRE